MLSLLDRECQGLLHNDPNITGSWSYRPQYAHPGASNEPVQLVQYQYLDCKDEKLLVKLTAESRQMRESFTTFVLSVASMLQLESISLDEVQLALESQLGCSKLDEHLRSKIDNASSIPSLLRAAMPFSSWYNYDLVGFLAKHFGGEKGRTLVCGYESQLQSHLLRRVIVCPPVSSLQYVPNGFESIFIKVDWDYRECTIQDITIFKEKLCKFLGREDPSVFILKSVEEGCVCLSWVVPFTVAQQVRPRVAAAASALAAERILYFSIGTDRIIDQVQF